MFHELIQGLFYTFHNIHIKNHLQRVGTIAWKIPDRLTAYWAKHS